MENFGAESSSSAMDPPHPHLLRLSRHASAPPQQLTAQISSPQASWPGVFLSELGLWWSNQIQNSGVRPSRALVVSATGNRVAIIDGHQIIFLARATGFKHAIRSSRNPLEAGFYTCGVWLEELEVFAAMTNLKCMVIMDPTGKELSRSSSEGWKTKAHALGMFAKKMGNTGGEERYTLIVLASDCSIYQIEYGPEGFCGLSLESISHAFMKKIHPQEVLCYEYNCDKSILALAGLSSGSRFYRSAGSYRLSLWRIEDFWRSVELLSYGDDLEREDPSVGMGVSKLCNFSLKLIMSPACNYIALLDSGERLQLVNLKQAPNGTLQQIKCLGRDDGRSDENMMQVPPQSKFSYFEVASVFDKRSDKRSQFESLCDVREACWWSEDALVLMKESGVMVIASVPDLRKISEFCSGVVCDKMFITRGLQRCVFLLETILEEPGQPTMGSGSVVDLKRSGWRLVRIQEYTLTQLFKALLENAEFDFALDLAERYKLEKDSVYKRQWLLSDWSLEAVQQILFKVKDKSWALKECLERVCPSMEAMNGILRHGLDLVNLCVGSGNLKHAVQDAAIGHICLSRLRLLQYSDRLETYLGLSMDRYTSRDYEVFRQSPLLDVALRLAELGKMGSVNLLYKRHIYSLTPFIFQILDAFPETISPHNYAQLLPPSKPFIPYIIGRERDWVEEVAILEVIEKYYVIDEDVPAVHLSSSTEYVVKASIGFVWPSETEVAEWYKRRAITIDKLSGQLENALTLLDLGKQKGLPGLEDLWEDLSSLHWVTYNNGEADEDIEMNLSLQDWQHLTDYEKFQAMLKHVNESNVLIMLNEKAVPFQNQKTRRTVTVNHQDQEVSFLVEWMKEIASKNQLQICAIVLIEALKDFGFNRLFKSGSECINAGIDCVYACPGVDQWDVMDTILSKLRLLCSQFQPNSEAEQSSSIKHFGKAAPRVVSFSMYSRSTENTSKWDNGVGIAGKEGVYAALDRKLQQAIGHVDAGRLLSNYQVPKPMKFLVNAQNDERSVKQLILSMLSKFGRRQPARSDAEWATMWDHLQRLQARAFTFLNRQFLFMEYYSSLLKAGKFSLAKSQLKSLGNNLLSPEKTESVIIQASRDYLFSASSLDALEIEKARSCLNLVPESKSIAAEIDYIDTVTIKLPALGVSLLPMQVKQIKDPMEIVRKALISSSSKGELLVDDVLDIAKCLGLNSEDRIAEVEEAIARQAAASGHIAVALHLCLGLMRRGYRAVWELCAALARGPELEGINLQLRKELLGFAISHCDDTSIGQLLLTWKEIDLSERCIDIKEAINDKAPFNSHTGEGFCLEPAYSDLQQQKGLLPGLRELLCKVVHIGSPADHVDENLFSKEQKKILEFLCLQLPWLLQAADVDSQKFGNWQHDDNDLVFKSVATMILGLAHCDLLAKDELLCYLAHKAMSRLSKDGKSLIVCGYLLNLVDRRRAADLMDQEMQHEEDLEGNCKFLNLALKYGSLLQEDAVSPMNSPKLRRERLLMTLRQSNRSTVSGTIDDNLSDSGNVFWKQWRSKILMRFDRAEHALELKPIIANFNMDQFISGDEKYVKDAIVSLVESAARSKSSELEEASRVDQYQRPNRIDRFVEEGMKDAESCSLDLGVLESKFKVFKKYLKYLNVKNRWVCIQTLMTATAMAVLKEKGEWSEDDWKERIRSLLHFWVTAFENSLDGEDPKDVMAQQAIEAISDLRVFCRSFDKLMQNNALLASQSWEVIAKIVNFPSCEEERARFLKAMVSSGCPYQTVIFVWQNATKNVKYPVCNSCTAENSEVSNMYVEVVSSSIEACSALCKTVPFDESCLEFEPALKAVASLSRNIESDDACLHQRLASLHEVRLCVWKTICDFAENLDVPFSMRVCLLKLREAIAYGHQQGAASCSFEGYLKGLTVAWVGWDRTSLAGERTAPLQHTIMALKSTELISAVWQDLTIKAEDLISVESATSLFSSLSEKVEHAQHVDLLIRLLKGWGDIFGGEKNESEGKTAERNEKKAEKWRNEEDNEHMDAEWGHADGWDDAWDESEEIMESIESVKRDSGSVNALHACWKTALAKLASFGEVDLLLHALDGANLRNGRTVLTKEESLELVSLFAHENSAAALKVSLLLPYKDAQDQALECFENKIRATMRRQKEMQVVASNDEESKQISVVDDCLLILALASGRFSTWVDNMQFSASFCLMCAALTSAVQTGEICSAFAQDILLPYFVASLTPTSQYSVACALVLQFSKVHPAFITWNGAYVALDNFLKVKASVPYNELDISSAKLKSLFCISNSVHHLQSQLRETLGSALQFLSNIYV